MKSTAAALALVFAQAAAEGTNPMSKVLDMLAGLEGKIVKEGEVAQTEYASYAEWCEDTAKSLQYEIRTGKAQAADLTATITSEVAAIEGLSAKIEDLVAKIANAETDLKAATSIREKEIADFAAEEKSLNSVLSALGRAIHILTEEMGKSGGASMLQLSHMKDVTQALGAMVQASMINAADGQQLAALVQSSSSDADGDAGAPDVAAYEGHSGNIIEVLEGLKDKAEDQLASARKTETQAQQNFEMLRQSLEDESKVASSEMSEAKNNMAASKENKEVAQGDLDVTTKDLNEDVQELSKTHQVCMDTAQEFEAGTKSRDEELGALAAAKKVLKEMTGAAEGLSYGFGQVSFLQEASPVHAVEHFMLELARKQDSKSLAQLAQRISFSIKMASNRGQDPFAKVKGLISEMIARLEEEGSADASHKAYCDKETYETKAKHTDKSAEIEKLTVSIDKMTSRIAVLKEEVATLTKELASIAKSQAEYDAWFQKTEATSQSNKADMKAGIEGVKTALKVLRDYYARGDKVHAAAEGAGGNIVGLLEVVEADFTKGLAEMQSSYDQQKAAYEQTTKENEVTTTAKNQDLKYKKKEMIDLTKALKASTQDRSGVQAELDAVNDYLDKINEQCIETAEPYEETKRRRDAEIAGLKDGLAVLEGEAVLLQSGHADVRRGAAKHLRRRA